MGRKLYVGNFPYETGEAELQELFARAGNVESVKVMRDMATGRARGFAFVEMSTDEEAAKAINELNDYQLGGRGLTVNEARPKPERSGGFGGGGYGGGDSRRRSEPRWEHAGISGPSRHNAVAMALFVSSFLVLFLETALIRWMPAYVRLLAYFSNFILLASFLGIGIGCLLASRRRNLFPWFPAVQLALLLAVYLLRLEVALPSTSTIYFSSGTAEAVVPVETTLLLPLLFA